MSEAQTLAGQTAVVTGGGRGIGRYIALALAKAGAKVAVTARTQDQLDETVQLVTSEGGQCSAYMMDVTNATDVDKTIGKIQDELGPIDLLVNNAGVGGEGATPWDVNVDVWWQVMEVNVRGAFLCAHAVLPEMIARQQGRIINVGSNAGFYAAPMASAYSVSKAALTRLTENLAASALEFNVQVFTISPGLVLTEMTRDVPYFKNIPASDWTPIERAGEVCVMIAKGKADKLTGRFLHVSEYDVQEIFDRADEIVENDLYAMRLRRFDEHN